MNPAKLTYSEKLKHPLWQKKRLEILGRDNFECKICFDKQKELHVHHREYVAGRDPWDYEWYNFITLCKDCHETVTTLKTEIGKQLDFWPIHSLFQSILDLVKQDNWAQVGMIVSHLNKHPEHISSVQDFVLSLKSPTDDQST